MGLDEIETTQCPIRSQAPLASSAPLQSYGNRIEKAAHRMRGRGYSYRRISRELHVRYDLVTSWLSGGESEPAATYSDGRIEPSFTAPRPPAAAPPPARPGPVASQAAEPEWRARAAALEQRVKDLLASLVQLSAESRERETRLSQAAESDRAASKAREERYFNETELLRGAIKNLEQRLGHVQPTAADTQRQRRFFWQRGRAE